MGLFNRSKKKNQKVNKSEIENMRLKQQMSVMKQMKKLTDNITTQMNGYKTFPEEFYTTGIKNGSNTGLMVGTNSYARKMSRMAHNESTVAQSLVDTVGTLTIGSGLTLESQPLWNLLPVKWSDKEKKSWIRKTETRYMLWSKRKSISHTNDMNRYQQEQQSFENLLIDGEYFELFRYSANSKRNPLTIQIIRPEDVRTPSGSTVAKDNSESQGIEYNKKGEAVAYHIYNYNTCQTVRVPRKGARSGRVLVNHVKLGDNRRGVGIIATITQELVKLSDYENLEVQAAVINALYAVWMKTPEDGNAMPTLNQGIGASTPTATLQEAEEWQNDNKNIDYTNGGIQVDNLPPGYEMQSFDTKRPNVNFGVFMDQVKKNIAASNGVSLSTVDKKMDSSYSAARGELLLTWNRIEKYRYNQSFNNDLVFKMWMWGEIVNNKIDAPDFFLDEDTMDSWCNAKWIGNQRPDIDPLRSVKAHVMEQNRGYRTGKQITSERGGGDWNENIDRVTGELQKIATAQEPMTNANDNGDDNLGDN